MPAPPNITSIVSHMVARESRCRSTGNASIVVAQHLIAELRFGLQVHPSAILAVLVPTQQCFRF
eukprot:m.39852 g.39852  ORF g.39852 m.39852 type:complete len:64 (+) comp12705_c0_seq2:900-1091(+)